jgi:hypothetical protein
MLSGGGKLDEPGINLADQQSVRFDAAFPKAKIIPLQPVRPVSLRQRGA